MKIASSRKQAKDSLVGLLRPISPLVDPAPGLPHRVTGANQIDRLLFTPSTSFFFALHCSIELSIFYIRLLVPLPLPLPPRLSLSFQPTEWKIDPQDTYRRAGRRAPRDNRSPLRHDSRSSQLSNWIARSLNKLCVAKLLFTTFFKLILSSSCVVSLHSIRNPISIQY